MGSAWSTTDLRPARARWSGASRPRRLTPPRLWRGNPAAICAACWRATASSVLDTAALSSVPGRDRAGGAPLERRPLEELQLQPEHGHRRRRHRRPPIGRCSLKRLMARYSDWSAEADRRVLPELRRLAGARPDTSLRRRSVQDDPPLSRRKDDRSLHLDAFTSQPVAGRRILRAFSNIDPDGAEREWAIADGGFEDFAQRFRRRARRLLPGRGGGAEGPAADQVSAHRLRPDHAGHARRRQARPRLPAHRAPPATSPSRRARPGSPSQTRRPTRRLAASAPWSRPSTCRSIRSPTRPRRPCASSSGSGARRWSSRSA